ncbi:MAG: lytic transglycosylase domain-containing protein [Rhodospirillaceae bacterium]
MVARIVTTTGRAQRGRSRRHAALGLALSGALFALISAAASQAQDAKTKPASSLILPIPKPPAPERAAPIYSPPASQPAAPAAAGEPRILSARDRDLLTQAVRAAAKRQWSAARTAAARAEQPLVRKIIEWAYLREPGPHVGFLERISFLTANPDWPSSAEMRRQAEASIDDDVSMGAVVDWFAKYPPLTTDGKVAYARGLRLQGKTTEAEALAREAWRTGTFGRTEESEFLRDFGRILTAEDHRIRVDTILYQEQTSAAERLLTRVDPDFAKVAKARIALITSARGLDGAIAAVPPSLQNDPGLIFDRIQWRRARDNYDEARALIPEYPLTSPRPDLWWRERHILARDALLKGSITEAYRLARHHGATDALSVSEGEWLAGWIALRFLKDGEAALPHFEKMYDTVQTPLSLAKGAYWVARTMESLGRADLANEWYARAAAYPTTYYGQLSFSRLKAGPVPQLPQDPVPTVEERNQFESRELTKALRILLEIDERRYQQSFAVALADSTDLAADRVMTAELVSRHRRPDLGVVIARQSARDKFVLVEHGFPVPPYNFADLPEKAFVLAIARQETNFDYRAVNAASGARGLMQLMPPTARAVARSLKLRYEQPRLTTDPAYNLRLGSSYLQSMVRASGGSYVVAAAAYNAGPGRTRQWVRQFGDPRDLSVNAIDWVEMIPFSETRNYVQRVMENVMVYRALLGGTREIGANLETELARRE